MDKKTADPKVSRREQYTLRVIREALLELLETKPLDKISVSELCTLADINRSTFYRHYDNTYALMEAINERAYHELFSAFTDQVDRSEDFNKSARRFIQHACTITEQNQKLFRMLLFGQPVSNLEQRLTESVFQLYMQAHVADYPDLDCKDLHFQFLVSGIMGIWMRWLKTDCRQPKETVVRTVMEHINGFFQVMANEHVH